MANLYLGGAFNPIHHGHLICARAAAEALNFDQLVLIPNHESPHKKLHPSMASAEHRLTMCRLAAAGFDGFEVDDLEIRRPSPSYTIDSVRELKHRGTPDVCWLIGTDQVMALPTWHEPQALLREARLIVMARPGFSVDWTTLPPELAQLARQIVAVPSMDISSTDIRHRVASGLPIDFLTPPAVCRYIAEQGLYRK